MARNATVVDAKRLALAYHRRFTDVCDFKKEDKEMAHKRKTITDLEQRVVERKKKYVRYQEGAELYSMGINTFREIARDAKATVRIKGIVLVNIEIFEEYLELFKEDF